MDKHLNNTRRLREIRENNIHFSSDLLNRDKDNDGVIDRYDADERDSTIQEIGDITKKLQIKRTENQHKRKTSKHKEEYERGR